LFEIQPNSKIFFVSSPIDVFLLRLRQARLGNNQKLRRQPCLDIGGNEKLCLYGATEFYATQASRQSIEKSIFVITFFEIAIESYTVKYFTTVTKLVS